MVKGLAKQTNIRIAIIGILLVIIAVLIILSGGGNIISKPYVEAQLKAFADSVAQDAKERGAQASFRYDDVTIKGMFFTKKAYITNPSLSISQGSPMRPAGRTTTISTPMAVVEPDKITGTNINVHFPSPFTVAQQGAPAIMLRFEGEPVYALARSKAENKTTVRHSFYLPAKLTVSQNSETNAGQPKTLVITYDMNPTVNSIINEDGSREGALNFRNIRITDSTSEKQEVTIGNFASDIRQSAAPNSRLAFDTTLSVNDIGVKTDKRESGPYSFKLSLEGTVPAQTMADKTSQPSDLDMTVREVAFTSDKFEVRAKGSINRKPDDMLPFGALDFAVNHYQDLLNSELVRPDARSVVVSVANLITGQPTEALQDLKFTVKRDKGGTLMVGQAPFEQLMLFIMPQLRLRPDAALPGSAPVTAAPQPEAVQPEPTPAPQSQPENATPSATQ